MDRRKEYLELIVSMGIDALTGSGPTPRAMIANLRMIADELEKMIPEGADEKGRDVQNMIDSV